MNWLIRNNAQLCNSPGVFYYTDSVNSDTFPQHYCVCVVSGRYSWAGKFGTWGSRGGPSNIGCPLCFLSKYVSLTVCLIKTLEIIALWAVRRGETASKQQHGSPCMHKSHHFFFLSRSPNFISSKTLNTFHPFHEELHICSSKVYCMWEHVYAVCTVAFNFVCPYYRDYPTAL